MSVRKYMEIKGWVPRRAAVKVDRAPVLQRTYTDIEVAEVFRDDADLAFVQDAEVESGEGVVPECPSSDAADLPDYEVVMLDCRL